MKKIIGMMFVFLMMVASATAITIKASTNTNLEMYCYNASSGALLGTSATLTCKDSAFNTELSGVTLTNVAAGQFNYTFNEEEDILSCLIDCPAGCLDTSFYLEVSSNQADIDNIVLYTDGDDSDGIDADVASVSAVVGSILADTAAYDSDTEYANAIWNAAIASYGSAGTYGLYVENIAQNITDTIADTNELQTNQNWDVWDDGTRTLTALDEDSTTVDLDATTIGTVTTATTCSDLDAISANVITAASIATDAFTSDEFAATGVAEIALAVNSSVFTLTSATETQIDNIEGDTNELQTDDYPARFTKLDTNMTDIRNTDVPTITGNQATIQGYIDTEVGAILQAIIGNATAWVTATGFSTHSAADVWSVATRALTSGAITSSTFATGAITADSIATDAIGNAEIDTGAIGSTELSTNAITSAELDTSAISEIWGANLLTSTVLADSAVAEISLAVNSSLQQLTSAAIAQIALAVNSSTLTTTSTISASDKADIALQVVNRTVNSSLNDDSLGETVWAIERYGCG